MYVAERVSEHGPHNLDHEHNMSLQFEVLDVEPGRFIYPDDIYDGLLAAFDGLLDDHGAGQLAEKPYLAALDRLLAEAPDFVDVYAHRVPLASTRQAKESAGCCTAGTTRFKPAHP
jgi:hypothetical protein